MKPGKLLAKMRAEKLRDDDRAKLVALRTAMRTALQRRKRALRATVLKCRVARAALRSRVEAFRAGELERIKRQVTDMRLAARQRCRARLCKIRRSGGALVARERARIKEERRLQEQLRRLAADGVRRQARAKASAKERRQESDDHVRGNLPPELVGVFDRVRKQIKGGPRTTRTEAFLQWAEENPGDVLHHQQHDTDREVARLVAEHQQVKGRLRKGKTHYRDLAAGEVPF